VVKGVRAVSRFTLRPRVIGDEVYPRRNRRTQAREVPLAISKAVDDAKKNMFPCEAQLDDHHESLCRFDAARGAACVCPPRPYPRDRRPGGRARSARSGRLRDVLANRSATTNHPSTC